MFTREQNLVFQNYLQQIIEKPRRIEDQPHQRNGQFLWCQDWEVIEILKCLFNGPDYLGDPPPNRLKNNPFFDKNKIVEQTFNISKNKTPQEIVEYLQALREGKVGGA